MTTNTPDLDWTWKTTPRMGAALVAGGAYTTAAVGQAAGLPPLHAALVAGGGAAAQLIADALRDRPAGHSLARVAAWLGTGAWTSATLAHHAAWTWPAASWWAGGTAAGMVLARHLAAEEDGVRAARATLALQKWANGMAGQWQHRLAELFRLEGHQVQGVKPWPGEVGYSVLVRMPDRTPHLPADADRILAAALRLPRGGGVQITDAEEYGSIIIRVTLADVMAKLLPFPDDEGPTTIRNPLALGLHPDGGEAGVPVQDSCTLLMGQTDSGKSNTVNVLNGRVAQTNDCLLWHIDITGAGISLPWLRAWALDGTASRPVVDWVAPTEAEAHIMLDVAIAGMPQRKTGYQDLMASVDDDKIPVSPEVPAILIVVDEVAELPPALMSKIDSVINVGRGSRIRAVVCGLRATQDVITAAMKKQARNRIGMRVSDPEELSHLFPTGGGRLDPRATTRKGSGYIQYPDDEDNVIPPRTFKGYRQTPAGILRQSIVTADRRPVLDALTADTPAGRYYASRWSRVLPLLYKDKPLAVTTRAMLGVPALYPPLNERGIPDTSADPTETTTPAPAPTAAAATGAGPVPVPPAAAPQRADGKLGRAEMEALFNRPRPVPAAQAPAEAEAAEQASPTAESTSVAEQFGRVLDQTGPTQWGRRRPTERDRARELLREAGPEGTGAQAIAEQLRAEGYSTARQTVQKWLGDWAHNGQAVRAEGGRHTRYVHPDCYRDTTPVPEQNPAPTPAVDAPAETGDVVDEELIAQAMELVLASQFGSGSMLMRRLRITYSTAEHLMATLEERGIVGPAVDGRAREVLKPADWWPRPGTDGEHPA